MLGPRRLSGGSTRWGAAHRGAALALLTLPRGISHAGWGPFALTVALAGVPARGRWAAGRGRSAAPLSLLLRGRSPLAGGGGLAGRWGTLALVPIPPLLVRPLLSALALPLLRGRGHPSGGGGGPSGSGWQDPAALRMDRKATLRDEIGTARLMALCASEALGVILAAHRLHHARRDDLLAREAR